MQKKLIAAAVAALVSTGAMADATMYGRIDVGYSTDSREVTGAAKQTDTDTGYQSALTTSRLGWNISEDLGGGLSAFGNLELGINALGTEQGRDVYNDANLGTAAPVDSNFAGVPFNTRTAYVGLKSASAGALSLGRQTVLVDTVMGVGSVGGLNNTIGAMYSSGGLGKLNNTRSSSLIQYVSPKMGGVDVAVAYGNGSDEVADGATGNTNTSNVDHEELGLRIQYSAGPLNVALGYSSEEFSSNAAGGAVTSEPTQMVLAANYDFGVAKVYAQYWDGDNTKTATPGGNVLSGRDGMEVGANFPLGAVNLFASFFTGETDNSTSADTDHSGFQLGAKYSLSKRTTAYALYGTATTENVVTASETELTQLALGIAHTF